jgi:hypothetical protein
LTPSEGIDAMKSTLALLTALLLAPLAALAKNSATQPG